MALYSFVLPFKDDSTIYLKRYTTRGITEKYFRSGWNITRWIETSKSLLCAHAKLKLVADKPSRMRVMSWNIDGLDTSSLIMRAKGARMMLWTNLSVVWSTLTSTLITWRILGVCREIEREDPDAVFLQEVVPDSLAILESKLINYKCIQAGGEGYFVAVLLKTATGAYCAVWIYLSFSSLSDSVVFSVFPPSGWMNFREDLVL